MPLLDHFHPPLSEERKWESFHGQWASCLGSFLNGGALPRGYFAEMQVSLQGRVEVDVATFERSSRTPSRPRTDSGGGTALLEAPVWAPPTATLEMAAVFPEEMEVLIFSREAGPTLVGAIELVSPGNKDCPEKRRAFAMKCLTYLHAGIGVVVVDTVTNRQGNLHDEMAELTGPEAPHFPGEPTIYAVAYRPVWRGDLPRIQIWPTELSVGSALPVLPLWLRDYPHAIRIDLEATYTEARQRSGFAG